MSNEEPLMYSQFCYYIQKDEEKRRLPCISRESLVNRLKLTGRVIPPTSLIRHRRDHRGMDLCRGTDLQPVCFCKSIHE